MAIPEEAARELAAARERLGKVRRQLQPSLDAVAGGGLAGGSKKFTLEHI